jgi:hypothetical protein
MKCKRMTTLLLLLMIILTTIHSENLSAESKKPEVIFKSGKTYVDVDSYNDAVADGNNAKVLLKKAQERIKSSNEVIEKVIVKDRIIVKEMEKDGKEQRNKGRIEGVVGVGVIAVIIIILVVVL